ncbi:lysophospholipid acyltransferase 7-like isoform X1 [Biomphalaria pfeifferi]|uniref:Lysophospholipid acyltransferase 7 n=1 Tax=Biomphalaria pfeifferi TaxID=112525 RepID=A0AAD8BQA4_BIOPF|nr:lysophospholipid acyltransferase 7-like isoform X1 [Biomphalaria pfeifferi]
MASNDVIYTLAMVISVALGPLFRDVLKDATSRKYVSAVLGFLLLLGTCGHHIIHLLITILGNCFILSFFCPSKSETSNINRQLRIAGISYLWNFGYLALFRTIHWFGIPAPSPVTNAAQLFLTLRMIGLAFEVQDTRTRNSDTSTDIELKKKYCNINVSFLSVITYALCYIGLFTGPYFKYRTYQDWLNLPNNANLNRQEKFIKRALDLPTIAVAFLFFSYFFNIQYVETEEFMERSFLYRLFYMVPMFIIFRTRLYMAWIMSELMSVTAGLGAYPEDSVPKCGEGPTDYKKLDVVLEEEKEVRKCEYNFETIHNIDIYGCELAPMTKQGLRSWNMTVQYWLANYVHKRVPQSMKAYRVAITMTVSAFWHGIHSGYYLSFLTVPPILMAEESMIKAFRDGKSAQVQKVFDWGCWFFKMRGFDYMCMGFLLLKLGSTLKYWYSIYFIGHVVMLLFLALGKVTLTFRPKKRKDLGDGDNLKSSEGNKKLN